MSDHTIVIIWVMKIFFVQFFCIFLPSLLNIFCFNEVIQFLSFMEPKFAWNAPLVSIIFFETSGVSHFIVFLYFLVLITEEGFLISPCSSLELCIQMGIAPFLLCFSLPFLWQLYVRPPQIGILLFCISFSWRWSWFLSPVQSHKPPPIVHQALYQI